MVYLTLNSQYGMIILFSNNSKGNMVGGQYKGTFVRKRL